MNQVRNMIKVLDPDRFLSRLGLAMQDHQSNYRYSENFKEQADIGIPFPNLLLHTAIGNCQSCVCNLDI